jgi:tRNA uracil 4-sulfurtransferase
MRYLIGRYHEVALKWRNRWRFVEQLKHNVRAVFADYRIESIASIGSRMMIALGEEVPDRIAIERGGRLFGIQNFSLSYPTPLDIDAMKRESIERVRHAVTETPHKTFRVRTRRDYKRFEMNSMAIDREIGDVIVAEFGLKVDLENPELTVSIEVLPDAAYISAGKIRGAGGLPVGITGHGIALLSGGIDSPVAAYRMMKRGLHLDFIHFHGHPIVSTASRDKAIELATHLVKFESRATLALIAFGNLQREIVANTARPLRVVLYRRFMLRIAAAIADRADASVLVTGESLGQVASQTLENMMVIQSAVAIPVMRPLVGMDKDEIIHQARALGTFETSILPDEDCCTLFTPAHPETHAEPAQVAEAESHLEVDRMVHDAVSEAEIMRLSFPG